MATTDKSYDLAKFQLTRILYNNSKNKSVCVLGSFVNKNAPNENLLDDCEVAGIAAGDKTDDKNAADVLEKQQAIIILEKTAFTQKDVNTDNDDDKTTENKRIYFSSETKLKQQFINDIYGNFECYPSPDINKIKATIICPVTDKHIGKYATQPIHIIQESGEIFKTITEPRLNIASAQFSLEWVYNILNHQQEVERIVFEDPCKDNGFVLLPDLKWDGKTVETLYLIAIVHRHNIKSIRDLTNEHLPLLYNIRDKGIATISKRYGIHRSQLRIYFHYQPSFYHLHVHFTYLKYDAPGIFCEKSHLLDTVINNIELLPDYYQKATLSFVLKENDAAFEQYRSILNSNNSNENVDTKHNVAEDDADDDDESPVNKKAKIE